MSKEDLIRAKEIYKAYILAMAFLPGNLSIFYGDEAGTQIKPGYHQCGYPDSSSDGS